jgi:4-hydroxybutyryl-CoA dehydratase/vinylacetyl-CoA-Delta-isomerase
VNTLLANTVKLNCTRFMYEISRLAHDVAGGFIATLPYEADFKNPETGPLINKYFAANPKVATEDRIRMARLLENMTGGTALAESMHGAGSPQAMRIMLYRESNLEGKKKLAKKLAKISEGENELCIGSKRIWIILKRYRIGRWMKSFMCNPFIGRY